MDYHVREFFSQYSEEFPEGRFYRSIALHEAPDLNWERMQEKLPNTCKGWFELAQLAPADRIEFVRDFWLMNMQANPEFGAFVVRFFQQIHQIGLYLTQRTEADPWEFNLVYCLKDDGGFFRGSPGATEDQILELKKAFPEFILPSGYLDFLKIHNGFSKTTDTTGLIPTYRMRGNYQEFLRMIEERDFIIRDSHDQAVDPKGLIPFYESFGMPYFQCFWNDWHPNQEIGSVYFSFLSERLPDVNTHVSQPESQIFVSFCDWLAFYLEKVV